MGGSESAGPVTVYTIGHSTREIAELIEDLQSFGVRIVIDVRTAPGSRRYPQFNHEALQQSLAAAGIGYRHAKALGGLRKPLKDSVNGAWRNASFRGFADYMQGEAFAEALAELEKDAAAGGPIALLCAEAVPWRCHRSLIADALTVRGHTVMHIMGKGKANQHTMTPWARVDGLCITYPPEAAPGSQPPAER